MTMVYVLMSWCCMFCIFFFKQKTAYEMRISDWSSDVCSSDLTRHGTDTVARTQHLRAALAELIEALPERQVPGHPQETLAPYLDDRVFNIIQLIYQAKPMEQQFKDYAFGRIDIRRHWDPGLPGMVNRQDGGEGKRGAGR